MTSCRHHHKHTRRCPASPLTTEESVEGVITDFSLIIRADFSREDVESTLVGGDFPVPGRPYLLCQELAAGEYILV